MRKVSFSLSEKRGTYMSGLVWAVYQVQTSRNVDRKTKRSNWWTVVVILAVLGIMYSKLIG
jgi:hypothetical protein